MEKIKRLPTRSERIIACEKKERGYMPDTNEMIDDIVRKVNELIMFVNMLLKYQGQPVQVEIKRMDNEPEILLDPMPTHPSFKDALNERAREQNTKTPGD